MVTSPPTGDLSAYTRQKDRVMTTSEGLRLTLIDNICDPSYPGRSGHSDIIWELSRQLLAAGHSITIVADYSAAPPFCHPRLRLVLFKTHPFDRRNGLGRIVHVCRAFRQAAALPSDLWLTTDAFSAGVTALLSRRVPVVFMTPANIYQRQASGYKLDLSAALFYRWTSYFAARRSAHIIATSHDLERWWRRTGAAADKVSVIPLGIESQAFALPKPLPGAQVRLLYVARFEGDNNPQLLLELAQRLGEQGVSFTLTAVGSGSLLASVKAAAADAGLQAVIHFHGHRNYEDLPALYAEHDIFVFVREAGGPPRVVLQALASGLAVVAFNSSGLEDYLTSGETGFLVRNGSVAELAAQVAELAQRRGLLLQVQQAARHSVAQEFDWSVISARYVALFSRLLGTKRPDPSAPNHPPQQPSPQPLHRNSSQEGNSVHHG